MIENPFLNCIPKPVNKPFVEKLQKITLFLHVEILSTNFMVKIFLAIGAFLGGLSVILGAFGAHSLRNILETRQLEIFETATRYQMYHALALILTGILLEKSANTWLVWAGFAFLVGVIIFSGSLYALALSNIKWLGAITPIGGVAFILGWIFILLGVIKMN